MSERIACFKAYDIRGRIPDQLNVDLAVQIGRAFTKVVGAKSVVVGYDIRLSSQELAHALIEGLTSGGADVSLIGQCGTEEVYFATDHLGTDGGIMVTASHNPKDYNGMKLVREGSRPISSDTGLGDIEAAILGGDLPTATTHGSVTEVTTRQAYVEHLLTYVDPAQLEPLKIVSNPGNGGAGAIIDLLEPHLPFDIIRIQHEPDGNFPNGIPNPLLPEKRDATASSVRDHGAALGLAWDGDFDRCFFFDEDGGFIEGYYIVGLLALEMLQTAPNQKIIYDPRLTWNTIDLVKNVGGVPVLCKSGHAFIKERMRSEDAVYGGEMSAHHYFRDFMYCDSGMIPWLLVAQAMSRSGQSLSALVSERMKLYPASGEINRRVDGDRAIARVRDLYQPKALSIETVDGIGLNFADWRFNLRKSNTEPLVRLNVESRGNATLMQEKTAELLAVIDALA